MKDFTTANFPRVPLSDVATVVNGGTPKSKVADYWGGDVQWLTPKDMGQMEGREISETPRTITQAGLKGSSARLVPGGSVILSTRAPIGHLAINTVPMSFNQGCRGIIPSEKLDPIYLFYFLDMSRDLLNELGSGTTFKELSATNLKSVEIPLPPLEEQQRIAAVLDDAFEGLARARTHAEANLKNARELFESAIEAALERAGGELVSLQEMMDAGMITSHLDGNHGGDYPRKEEFVSEGVPYISANCIAGNEIDFGRSKYLTSERADGLRKGIAKNRDVLFAHNATVGPVTLLKTDEEKVILSTSLTYYRCNEDELIPEFLVCEMRSAGFRRQYEAVMAQATRNQVPITMQRRFTHLVPPLSEQRRIAVLGVELEANCNLVIKAYEASLQDLDNLRQSLLQKAFAGELT